jgi:hypothetical protein
MDSIILNYIRVECKYNIWLGEIKWKKYESVIYQSQNIYCVIKLDGNKIKTTK